jgi:putative addiction module component (TIGR02574 family)
MPETPLDPAAPLRLQHPEPFHGTSDCHHSGRSKLPPSPAGGFTMATQLEVLEAEALKLPVKERAEFAQRLLASLDPENEELWSAEVERRIAEIESGAAQVVPIAEALAQVRATLA